MNKDALVAALRCYARPTMDSKQHCYLHTHEDGSREMISIWNACEIAANSLDVEYINTLKLKALQDGLKKHGMEMLYEKIMGEKL